MLVFLFLVNKINYQQQRNIMFKKFKEMVLETLVQGEARFQVEQDKARARFRDPNETPEQVQQRMKEINDMMKIPTPEEDAQLMARIKAGTEPTYAQIMRNQKEADDQAVMLKTTAIRQEVNSWGEKAQTKVVLEIVADSLKSKAVDGIKSIRDKAFGNNKNNENKFKWN